MTIMKKIQKINAGEEEDPQLELIAKVEVNVATAILENYLVESTKTEHLSQQFSF